MDIESQTSKSNRKHASRACLECRKRHFKCDSVEPICGRCSKSNRDCIYVESHRGGSRKKGVSKKAQIVITEGPPINSVDIEDFPFMKNVKDLHLIQKKESHVRENKRAISDEDQETLDQLFQLPCAKETSRCNGSDCQAKMAVNLFKNRHSGPLSLQEKQLINKLRKKIKLDHNIDDLDCIFANKEEIKQQPESIEELVSTLKIHTQSNFMDLSSIDAEDVIKKYYEKFHWSHPLLPPKNEIHQYINDSSIQFELIPIMKVVTDGYTKTIFSKNIDLISDRISQCIKVVNDNGFNDIISIQSLILISIIAHISSLHKLSKTIRHLCVILLRKLEVDNIDKPESTPQFQLDSPISDKSRLPILQSSRLGALSGLSIADNARRCFWELHFFDVIIGSADGRTVTKMDALSTNINYPNIPDRESFDYKSRAEATKLVTEAVKLNIEVLDKLPVEATLTRLKASVSNFAMKLENPKMFNAPSLVSSSGKINEGVHQAILLFNYAKIFVHRPFSFLWKINSPQNPKCEGDTSDEEGGNTPTQSELDSRAVIETRKTIEAAISIVQALIDTDATKVLERTPLFACALALAALVFISAYIWVENSLKGNEETLKKHLTSQDLDTYSEYITLSLSAIYPISNHWILSGKLARHIRESLVSIRPELYSKLKENLPHIEIKIEQELIKPSPPVRHVTAKQKIEEVVGAAIPSDGSIKSSVSSFSPESFPKGDLSLTNSSELTSVAPDSDGVIADRKGSILEYSSFFQNSFETQFDPMNYTGQLSPVSDTGCDWIDKALQDYFEVDNLGLAG
ncbi:MADS box transcription factor [Scheffersomyces coipomensis]|uniref:MADS box transcription factor n=1 Tax=Scheffersomyces coipomensis TaxID=1788519 RepID=UPI00315D86D3